MGLVGSWGRSIEPAGDGFVIDVPGEGVCVGADVVDFEVGAGNARASAEHAMIEIIERRMVSRFFLERLLKY